MARKTARFLTCAWRDTGGTSAIEFAIVAPVFFALIFGIVIYGTYFASVSLVNHIAYEAARATIAGLTDAERASLAQARANELIADTSSFLNPKAISVVSAPQAGGLYTVTVHYDFNDMGLSGVSFLPLPPSNETASYTVSDGGY